MSYSVPSDRFSVVDIAESHVHVPDLDDPTSTLLREHGAPGFIYNTIEGRRAIKRWSQLESAWVGFGLTDIAPGDEAEGERTYLVAAKFNIYGGAVLTTPLSFNQGFVGTDDPILFEGVPDQLARVVFEMPRDSYLPAVEL